MPRRVHVRLTKVTCRCRARCNQPRLIAPVGKGGTAEAVCLCALRTLIFFHQCRINRQYGTQTTFVVSIHGNLFVYAPSGLCVYSDIRVRQVHRPHWVVEMRAWNRRENALRRGSRNYIICHAWKFLHKRQGTAEHSAFRKRVVDERCV